MSDYDSDFPGNFTNDEDYDNWFHILGGKLADANDHFATKKESTGSLPYCENPSKDTTVDYQDACITIGESLFKLDRVKLALKSDYFEKLLTAEFSEKNCQVIDLRSIDSDTFTSIVDIIYGTELSRVLNFDNFVELLLAMDYLQMEINLDAFRDILYWNLKKPGFSKSNICKLLHFVERNTNFEYLLSTIYQYLSTNLIDILGCEDFLTLSLAQLEQIIVNEKYPQYEMEKCKIAEICAVWICADIENRLDHAVALVNAVKYRYDLPFKVKSENFHGQFLRQIEEKSRLDAVERYFDVLINYYGEIDPEDDDSRELSSKTEPTKDPAPSCVVINKMNEKAKWVTFLENCYFYDITVKVQNKTYKLHRLKLKSSEYFAQLSTTIDKDEEQFLEDIDQTSFEILMKFLYFEEIALAPGNIAGVLKASHILMVKDFIAICKLCIRENAESIPDDFVEILNFIRKKEEFEEMYEILLDVIVETWPEVGTFSNFCSISYDNLLTIVRLKKLRIKHSDELLDICSKWIAYDAKNRYNLMLRLATAINRNYMAVYGQPGMEIAIDMVDDFSQRLVENKLRSLLSSTRIVPRCIGSIFSEGLNFDEQQVFVSEDDGGKCKIFDASMNEVASMNLFKITDKFHPEKSWPNRLRSSAAIVKENVFVLQSFNDEIYFSVYNSRLKKFYSLASATECQTKRLDDKFFQLLNCTDELYCCFSDGQVLKYSMELNRWMMFSEIRLQPEEDSEYKPIVHISDGKALYRVYRKSEDGSLYGPIFADYSTEVYDTEQNDWLAMPKLYSKRSEVSSKDFCFKSSTMVSAATVVGDLAIIFAVTSTILLFDYDTRSWRELTIPYLKGSDRIVSVFSDHRRDEMYITTTTNVYRVTPSNGKYTLVRTFVCNAQTAHGIWVRME